MYKTFTILGALLVSIGIAMPALVFEEAFAAGEPTIQIGTESADTQTFTGTADDDAILQLGLGGDDVQDASGLAGNDYIYQDGADGNNSQTARGGAGDDQIFQYGGAGNDRIIAYGDEGNDLIDVAGGAGNDDITAMGGDGDDQVIVEGGEGNDTITVDAGGGNDFVRVDGGAGDDVVTYNVSSGSDVVSLEGGAGTNKLTVNGNKESYTVRDEDGTILHQVGTGGTVITVKNFQEITYGEACTYTITPTGPKTFTSGAGMTNISVKGTGETKKTVCPAPAITPSDASWITATPSAWKSNKQTVKVAVTQRDASTDRSGNVIVDDKTFQITQKGATCALGKFIPTSQTVPVTGNSYTFQAVVTPQDCAWQTTANKEWIQITSGTGTGTGDVAYTVPANTDVKKKVRTGIITVILDQDAKKKRTFTVRQLGK
jgi:hypothetical protein